MRPARPGHEFAELPVLLGSVAFVRGLLRCSRCGCMSLSFASAPWYLPPGPDKQWQADRPECLP